MSEKIYGWTGKILRVDLTTGNVSFEETSKYSNFIGGRGIASKLFYDEVSVNTGPYDKDNLLIFMTGPLTGTPLPSTSRIEVCSKSPMGYPEPIWVRSSLGGSFGPELKYAGFDGIIIRGKSDKPVYLYLHDNEIEIKDATFLWGKDTFETQLGITGKHGQEVKTACIGPAGENLVSDAIILHQMGHASGLGGFGAVMGSKNLKAIVAKGTVGIALADSEKTLQLVKEITPLIYDPTNPPGQSGASVDFSNNWGSHEDDGREFAKQHGIGKISCHGCPVSCYPKLKVPGLGVGSQICYWTIYGLFGAKTWKESWEIGNLADRAGVSMIGFANIRDWLVRLLEEEIITEKEINLKVGAGGIEFYRELIPMIAFRKGFGNILAEGLPRAAEKINKGQDYIVHHRGWVDKIVDPRSSSFGIIAKAMENRIEYGNKYGSKTDAKISPPDNLLKDQEVSNIYEQVFQSKKASDPSLIRGKAFPTIHTQNYRMLIDSLTLCARIFPFLTSGYGKDHKGVMHIHSMMYSAVTGIDTDEDTLFKAGERLYNLDRLLGLKYGYSSKEKDRTGINEKFFKEVYKNSRLKNKKIDREAFEEELNNYYELRGWDKETGIPTDSKLDELGLRKNV
jgi:aldehyde:ferredoxin oxidoreductase